MDKRPALGKGLSALIPDAPERTSPIEVDVDRLAPNDFQPRAQVDDARLEELTRSIKSNGIIQPIVARKVGDRFQIIAGERRWRAAMRAGLARVPVVVRDVAPGQERSLLEMALVENIQREDLNPIEEAQAYRRLTDEFQLKQDQIADAVGKDRASVANTLRLLKLPDEVRAEVAAGTLSMGHARALLALEGRQQESVAKRVADRALSVRQTEQVVNDILHPKVKAKRKLRPDRDIARLEEELSEELGTTVEIKPGKKGAGKLVVSYSNPDHLDDLLSKFRRKRSNA